ncbi:MAG: urate hydroxylase PuuD [Chloroflexi bacterium]|nr:urate hydroxylase PuuD [Chloroflexota bacterium]
MLVSYLLDWLHLAVRWLHVIVAIAWVGASFYFIALDQSLHDAGAEHAARGVGGEAWEIHGGGFYRIEKFRVAPTALPASLRWFKWEAYLTWLSGFGLMVLLYYVDPATFLVDPRVMPLEGWVAVAASLAILGLGWLAYDGLSRALASRPIVLAAAITGLVLLVVFASTQLFSARAAFIQTGATIGTWMAANVLFTIIPGQRELVRAMREGRAPYPLFGLRGKQRSVHNNYLTLPVIFAMISQHFPFTYGNAYGALILVALMAAGVLVQHYLNTRHTGESEPALLFGAAGIVAVVALLAGPSLAPAAPLSAQEVVAARQVFEARCVACHAAKPADLTFSAPPKGLSLETDERIKANARNIYQQVVVTRAMPLANKTGMTEDERDLIARWFRSGAPLP